MREIPTLAAGGMTLVQVVAGDYFSCGLTPAGAGYCWGGNGGSLGDGTTTNRLTPTPVAGGLTFMALSARASHTCGVTPAGSAYCWGLNSSGQLGDGTLTTRTSPVLVTGGLTFTAVSAGSNSTCGLTAAGAVYCWGSNGSGQLGDGTTIDKSSPVLVAGGMSFVAVSVGESHACGLTSTGAAYCWGQNGTPQTEAGKLGNGTMINSSSPVPVAGNITFATISAGGSFTCGTTADGPSYCWGANHRGALGDGTGVSRSTPGPVLPPFTGPAKLAFIVQPSDGVVGQALSPAVQVEIQDADGVRADVSGAIHVGLGTNQAGATLAGTTTAFAVHGVATFSGLLVDRAGVGYRILAAYQFPSGGATSASFNVSAATATLRWQARRWK